jgi:hypothetical membrane protein
MKGTRNTLNWSWRSKHLAYRISVIGVAQFMLLTFAAALIYPGGYNVTEYYFSDLGATMARNGEPNLISSVLFSTALSMIAVALVPFWFAARSVGYRSRFERLLSVIGSTLGLLSSPFIIGVALAPMDTMLEAHILMFFTFFPLFMSASLAHSVSTLLNRRQPARVGILGLALFAISLLVLKDPLNPYVPLLQKVLIYGYFSWVFMFANQTLKLRSQVLSGDASRHSLFSL